ncbi:MAG: ATP-binding protein [Lachnospiraceae bacterium]|nr:ATP-binding protein [Candidatus Darwinimomas equi]
MLCQFSFQNFKSYKNETTLDYQAAALPEFIKTLITKENAADLLPVSVLYGPNGGGKSNLLQALGCVISTVVKPVYELEKNRQEVVIQQKVDAVPFLFDQTSAGEPTEFRLYFRVEKNEYRYYLSIRDDEIISESLYRKTVTGKKPALIFEREMSDITIGPSVKSKGIGTNINPKMPYLSFLAINYDIDVISEVMSWLESCIILNYANPKTELQVLLVNDDPYKNQFIHALNDMDIDISDYRYDEDKKMLYMKRNIGEKEYEFPFNEESDGTRKLIAALPVILLALREGRLVIIDELDAKLHPKLLKYVIMLFKNKEINKLGAQLLFTSHDMYTMTNSVFRRDEIWFAAENEAHESEIYSLHEIRGEDNGIVKNTAAYNKQYLEGRYGADPYLSNMLGGAFA